MYDIIWCSINDQLCESYLYKCHVIRPSNRLLSLSLSLSLSLRAERLKPHGELVSDSTNIETESLLEAVEFVFLKRNSLLAAEGD